MRRVSLEGRRVAMNAPSGLGRDCVDAGYRELLVRWIGSWQRGSYTSETARSAFWVPLFGDGVEDSNVVCLLLSACRNTGFKTLSR